MTETDCFSKEITTKDTTPKKNGMVSSSGEDGFYVY
jgi:hypothetical protein